MARAVLFLAVCLIAHAAGVLSVSGAALPITGSLMMTTYDPDTPLNNTLIALAPANGVIKSFGDFPSLLAIDYTHDSRASARAPGGMYYVEVGIPSGEIHAVDAKTGKLTQVIDCDDSSITNLEFDDISGLIIGIRDLPEGGNEVVSINPLTGQIIVLANFPNDLDPLQDASSIDIKNRTYYSFVIDDQAHGALMCVDIAHPGRASWLVYIQYDLSPVGLLTPKNGSGPIMIGYDVGGIFALDIFSGRLRTIVNDIGGDPATGGLSIDSAGEYLFVAMRTDPTPTLPDGAPVLQVYDLGHLTQKPVAVYPLPDDVRFLAYFPLANL